MLESEDEKRENIHATGLVYRGFGLLIRGKSGLGKSLLALYLLDFAGLHGLSAQLVGDDRLDIQKNEKALYMSPPESLAGKIELWGRGIIEMDHLASAPVDLVVDLLEQGERMPATDQFSTSLSGIKLARCPLPSGTRTGPEHQRLLLEAALKSLGKNDNNA